MCPVTVLHPGASLFQARDLCKSMRPNGTACIAVEAPECPGEPWGVLQRTLYSCSKPSKTAPQTSVELMSSASPRSALCRALFKAYGKHSL